MTAEKTLSNLDEQLWGRIHRVFAERSPGAEVGALRPLPGGHSGRTYRLAVDGRELVVKAAPEGREPIGRHDVLRQSRLLLALEQTDIPVPRVVATDETGAPWFAMTFVEGEAVEPVLDDPLIDPALARTRMHAAVDMMARFHALVPSDLGVTEPAYSPSDELDRWSRTLRAVPAELVPHADTLRDKLAAAIPEATPPAMVHGDFRLGNLLCVDATPTGLIDWEIWSVGDPRVEVGWFALFGDAANFPGVGTPVDGLPDPDELVAAYQERTGLSADFPWFRALGSFKMAVIMTHNLVRHREGRHDDPQQELLPDTITHLIRGGFDLLADGPRPL